LELSDEKKKRIEDNFEDKLMNYRKIKETTRPEWFLVVRTGGFGAYLQF
jgi:hypothetical protein